MLQINSVPISWQRLRSKSRRLLRNAQQPVTSRQPGNLMGYRVDGQRGAVSLKCGIRKVYFRHDQHNGNVAKQHHQKPDHQRIESR